MTTKARRLWLRRLGMLLLAALFLFIMLRWFEHKQTYHPSRSFHVTGGEFGRPWEDVMFKASDGVQLNGWFYPADIHSPRSRLAILVCHGNGGNISHRLHLYDLLLRTGASVFAFDYRGYGKSGGRPGEEGTYRDAQAAYDWLRGRGFEATNIIAYGESLGGGIASELARRETVGGLILQSTFTSVPDLGAELFPFLPVRTFGSIHYDTRSKLPQLHVPVLVLHSRSDTLIRFHHAEQNFAAANQPKFFVELNGDHNDGLGDGRELQSGLDELFRQIEGKP